MSDQEDELDRKKLLDLVAQIRSLLAHNEVIGTITLAGRGGSLENHFLFDAPWFKIIVIEDNDTVALRLMSAKGDPIDQLADTMGALRGLAELNGVNGLAMLRASDVMDAATGAEHTPMYKPKKGA